VWPHSQRWGDESCVTLGVCTNVLLSSAVLRFMQSLSIHLTFKYGALPCLSPHIHTGWSELSDLVQNFRPSFRDTRSGSS
jgi:hypothetical protein